MLCTLKMKKCSGKRTHRRLVYTHVRARQHTLRNAFSVNIFPICILSGWNPVFSEPCAANSSPLHPSILLPRVLSRAKGMRRRRDRSARSVCVRLHFVRNAFVKFSRTCACRAFASVILNIKERYFNIGRQTRK